MPSPVTVNRLKKMVIVSQREVYPNDIIIIGKHKPAAEWRIVAYPDPKYFELFADKVNRFRTYHSLGSHQETNPSGIGTLLLNEEEPGPVYRTIGNDSIHLVMSYVQAHFRTGNAHWQVPRSLATHYGGWRIHCFEEAIHIARGLNAYLSIPRVSCWTGFKILPDPDSTEKNPLQKDIEIAVANLSAVIVHTLSHLIIDPN